MAYPKNFLSYINAVSGVGRQTLKFVPRNTDGVKQGAVIVLDAPSNSMLDLDTLVLSFLGSTTSTDGCVFPRNIETIIQKIQCEVNGLSVGTCNNLSDLYQIMFNLNSGADATAKRALYQKSKPVSAPTGVEVKTPYKIHSFLGMLDSIQGRVLDLGVIGSLRIHITLEGTNVLVKSATSTNEGFQLDDIYMTCDSINIADDVFYKSKNAFLAQGGCIEMPFTNYYSALFPCTSFNQSNRFSVSTNSLDYMLACFPKNRNLCEVDAVTGQSAYFNYSANDGTDANSLVDWNFQVNSVQVPQFKAKKDHAYALLQNVMGTSQCQDGGISASITDASVWDAKFWVAGVRLNLLTSPDERTVSGLVTTGTNATLAFETTGKGSYNPVNLLVFAASTCILRISAGKDIQVVQ